MAEFLVGSHQAAAPPSSPGKVKKSAVKEDAAKEGQPGEGCQDANPVSLLSKQQSAPDYFLLASFRMILCGRSPTHS